MSQIRHIAPAELARIAPDALLLDVREPAEFAGKRLPNSLNAPLSRLEARTAKFAKTTPLVILCRSGRRSLEAAQRLEALGFSNVSVIEGGLLCCSGLENGPGGVWSMERQVRMAAGSLVLAGATLGFLVHYWFWLLSAGVGAGLVFSAATDTCGMAAVLARMPWNRERSTLKK